jgi:hypothetical protein
VAAYVLVTGAEDSGALELRISKFENDLWVPISILHLTRATLQECVEAAEARVHGAFDETAELWCKTMARLALTMLLYFGGGPDVVCIVHPASVRPSSPSLSSATRSASATCASRLTTRLARNSAARSSDVKSDIAAIRSWRQEEQCGRTCATRIPTCTGPDQAARNRACASSFQSPSRAARDRRGAIRH